MAQPYDLVVYGATAGGVIASISAARMGLMVALIEPGRHVGGMVSGGLSHTDLGKREVIGGYSLEFYWRAGSITGCRNTFSTSPGTWNRRSPNRSSARCSTRKRS